MTTDVAIFAPKYPPDVGGAAVYFDQVVEQLRETDYRPTVFAPQRPDAPRERELPGGGRILRPFPQGLIRGVGFVPTCLRLLRSRPFACAHVHPHFPQWRVYRWILKALGLPRVYDCRDLTFVPRYVSDGDAYLSASAHIDQRLRDRVGVDLSAIHRSPVVVEVPTDLPAFSFRGSGPHVTFVGDLTRSKGIHRAVNGVIRHRRMTGRDTQLHVFGDGPLREEVCRLAHEFDWLVYHGPVPHRRAIAAMRAADAVVLPSETEGRPRVVLEARAVGTPVVAFPVGDVPRGEGVRLVENSREGISGGIGWSIDRGGRFTADVNSVADVAEVRDAVTAAYSEAIGVRLFGCRS